MLISVCMCTYRRAYVQRTLASLAKQRLDDGIDVEIIVVDNDATRSGEAHVAAARAACPWPITYAVEPEQNIARARNHGLALAQGMWIAMIDDDEIAEPDWLMRLYRTAKEHDADVVIGHVEPDFHDDAPAWIVNSQVFARDLPATGTPVVLGRSGNALLRRAILPPEGERFLPAYGLSGGEDYELFHRLHRRGATIVACREAVVHERLEGRRLTAQYVETWLIKRGESHARVAYAGASTGQKGAVIALSAVKLALLRGLALLTRGNPVRHHRYRGKALAQWGKIRALSGRDVLRVYASNNTARPA